MKTFKLGSLAIDPAEYGSHGNAVLGIRGSGKSYTATCIAEHLFDAGIPFIAFDPVGIWRHLRVPGKGKGYPIVVAGGKDGDLPLTVAGTPAIVRAAMQGGISLVIDLFDINLSKADWRRIVKPQPTMHDAGDCTIGGHYGPVDYLMREIYPKHMARFWKGDRLWVREAWRCNGWASDVATIFYRASEGDGYTAMCEQWPVADHKPLRVETKWSPSLHMPRWASRLTLTVTDVRVQRLQEISEADARDEGAPRFDSSLGRGFKPGFQSIWTEINGAVSWGANPWIVALTFTVEKRNIDHVG